ncbi:hypothetical protein [Nocardia suismassiliense]|uniref:hypothetical protein n=1 Tax=Nocardia suismassiliense TaxID=2077092 RepID=UPI000D1FBD7F|nr:hypothetical protein [Nocardia suismassiliense]
MGPRRSLTWRPAVAIFADLDDPAWEGWASAILADRYGEVAQWDKSAEYAERALQLAAQLGGAAFEPAAEPSG